MKKLFLGTLLLALIFLLPLPSLAEVSINIGVSLPPLIRFAAPPRLVVVPETYAYVVPDVGVDIFFYDGWWWRPWEGRWYRSRHYNSGWYHYKKVPTFYRQIPRHWRNEYRQRHWRGHQWNAVPIPHHEVQKNWKDWKKNKYWENKQTWGVRGLRKQKDSRQYQEGGRQFQQDDRRKHDRYDRHDRNSR